MSIAELISMWSGWWDRTQRNTYERGRKSSCSRVRTNASSTAGEWKLRESTPIDYRGIPKQELLYRQPELKIPYGRPPLSFKTADKTRQYEKKIFKKWESIKKIGKLLPTSCVPSVTTTRMLAVENESKNGCTRTAGPCG